VTFTFPVNEELPEGLKDFIAEGHVVDSRNV
jgi:hypothetical protein